jgi:hypothetical protein
VASKRRLVYGSEFSTLGSKEKQNIEVAQIRFLLGVK